ncbi:MAG: corrinoid protein [Deltaproteobacteria bacterium]|nr:MAG: corrinoid protein [Deltaproteobacteria bacterium]
MFDYQSIIDTLIKGDQAQLTEMVKEALNQEVAAEEILNSGLIAGMDIVGEKMENEEMFIPEVLRSAKVMGAALEILRPQLREDTKTSQGKVVIGTVKGDLHDIGKNLVAMMLESSGLEVYNLGVDVAPEDFVTAVKEKNAQLLGLSALLTTTMPMMKNTVEAVTESGIRNQVKIVIGGAPVTKKFADDIGADGYAPDAGAAVKLAKTLLQ